MNYTMTVDAQGKLLPLVCDANAKLVDVLLVPDGDVTTTRGKKNFTVGSDDYEKIVSEFSKLNRQIVIDYEHQTLGGDNAPKDGTAPAAGWIHELRYEQGRGIIGSVEWTPRARKLILAGEYRYLSPVLMIETDEGESRPYELIHAAITNDPAIHGMERLAASRKKGKKMPKGKKSKKKMDMFSRIKTAFADGDATPEEQAATVEEVVQEVDAVGSAIADLRVSLGMAEDAPPEEVVRAAIEKLAPADGGDGGDAMPPDEAAANSALTKIRSALAMKSDATEADIVKAIDKITAGSVSAEDYSALKTRLDAVEGENRDRNVTTLIDQLVADGKLNPNDTSKMKWAHSRATTDISAFSELMDGAPVVVPVGKVLDGNNKTTDSRKKIIADSVIEYNANRKVLAGTDCWAFVNESLKDEDMETLTKSERESLDKE